VNTAVEIAFDRWAGVSTRVPLGQELSTAAGGDAKAYEPAHLLRWHGVHGSIPVAPETATFVDLGAGQGRAMVLATMRGYRRVVGVELDEELAAQARTNVARLRAGRVRRRDDQELHVVHGDAAAFDWPPTSVVVWMYNPFGADTMRQVLHRICHSVRAPGSQLFVAYFNPVHRSVFADFPRLVEHAQAKRWVVYRLDAAGSPTSR
jgi:16S rRNA G966 N2-methylase RsmD